MDILQKDWRTHLSVGLAAVVLGFATEKGLKKKTVDVSSLGNALTSFAAVSAASAGAEYGLEYMKKKDPS